jgi:syndecan 2
MLQRIYPVVLCCVFFVARCTSANEKVLQDLTVDSEEDIFIDDAQADPIEGSAVAGEFSDLDDGSGIGPDDEDSTAGSGDDGSGAGYIDRGRGVITIHDVNAAPPPPPPPKKPQPTKKPEFPPKSATPDIPHTEGPSSTADPQTTPSLNNGKEEDKEREGPELTDTEAPVDGATSNNGVSVVGPKNEDRPTSFFAQPGILAAVIGGAVVGLLCAILLVMFIVYRMRKKDEGSYALDEPKRSPTSNSYTRTTNKEFYA